MLKILKRIFSKNPVCFGTGSSLFIDTYQRKCIKCHKQKSCMIMDAVTKNVQQTTGQTTGSKNERNKI